MLLAGDIGGAKTDLALYSPESGPRSPLKVAEFASQDYPSLEVMARAFLSTLDVKVEAASFAIAGPVIGSAVKTTNLPWLIEADALAASLGVATVQLLNDMEAMAHAVPLLQPEDLYPIAEGDPVKTGSLAIIAPGTGLGEAFLTWDGARYVPHASEGGHADFAPAGERQIELLRYLKQRMGHVSFERVCSGIGVPNIYDFLAASGSIEPPEVAKRIAASPDRTRTILQIALEAPQPSPRCAATLAVLCAVLGSEAGNLALKVMATGGVYLAGGIATHILPALEDSPFLSAFRDKGRFGELLARVPVRVITAQAALMGAAVYGLRVADRGQVAGGTKEGVPS